MRTSRARAWVFLLPAAALLAFVGVIPLVINTWHSFFDIFTLDSKFWVGSEWYAALLTSTRFWASLGRSLLFSATVLAVQIPLGLAIALLLPRTGPLRTGALMLLAVPLVMPWNMIPTVWLSLVNPESGLLGQVLAAAGLTFDWQENALHTWALLLLMDTWHWVGLVAILAYSGLSGIRPSLYQAAAIDQASRWQVFRHIQLPALTGVLTMAILLRFMDSFMIYTEAFGLNAGGPDGATTFLSLDLGEEIGVFNYGPAAARSVVYVVITLSLVLGFTQAYLRRRDAVVEQRP